MLMGLRTATTVFTGALVLSCGGMAMAAGPAAPEMRPLVPHRAVYELTLMNSSGNKAPTSARGRIAFDFTGSVCDGYSQTFRQFTELQPQEGPTRVSDMRSVTYEDGEGRNFRFKVETKIDSTGTEDIDGRAQKSGDGALSIALARPRTTKLDLDRDVVFPTEHLRRILIAARDDQRLLQVKVFDGSENGQKVFETTSVIGKAVTAPPSEAAANIPMLNEQKRWPVSISYFEENKADSAPAYVLSFDLYENGISRALKLDYGDFVLSGEMTKLEILPLKACKK